MTANKWGLIATILALIGLGFAAMSTNPPFVIHGWVPYAFFGGATACIVWLIILFAKSKSKRNAIRLGKADLPQLSNRKELISAIHQVKETTSEVILNSAILGQWHELGKDPPPQRFVTDFSNAFRKYKEALKSLEREALIAGEAFHNPINSFFVKINSCVQNPAPPIKQPGSTVVCLDNPENANKLNTAMNEVVKEIDEINQLVSHKEGYQP